MAMSVAENAPVSIERTPRGAQQQLAVGSFVGALYVLISLWVVLAGIPLGWDTLFYVPPGSPPVMNEFLSATLLMMLSGTAAVALGFVGYQLIRNQHQPGLRAGIFFASVMIFLALWISEAIASMSEGRDEGAVGLTIAAVLLVAFLVGIGFLFLQVAWGRLLEAVEDQGWFHAHPFKGSQGVRVRRGTVLGVLILGGCGIYTMVMHGTFGSVRAATTNWYWNIPGTGEEYYLPLMYSTNLLMPVLLGLVLVYFAWRLVNVPAFADFLIATEAEMNKVSWTTRRRLIQDTIVVLVTVVLMTVFLFAVDIMWIWLLGSPFGIPVGVLQYDPRVQQQKQQEKNQW
jgi:preprotein translocase SecE subunit